MLSKSEKSEKKLRNEDELNIQDKAKYFIGNTPLKELFKKLPKENVIYAFSQRHKATIARNALHDI